MDGNLFPVLKMNFNEKFHLNRGGETYCRKVGVQRGRENRVSDDSDVRISTIYGLVRSIFVLRPFVCRERKKRADSRRGFSTGCCVGDWIPGENNNCTRKTIFPRLMLICVGYRNVSPEISRLWLLWSIFLVWRFVVLKTNFILHIYDFFNKRRAQGHTGN